MGFPREKMDGETNLQSMAQITIRRAYQTGLHPVATL
jgi:hypothetical protein